MAHSSPGVLYKSSSWDVTSPIVLTLGIECLVHSLSILGTQCYFVGIHRRDVWLIDCEEIQTPSFRKMPESYDGEQQCCWCQSTLTVQYKYSYRTHHSLGISIICHSRAGLMTTHNSAQRRATYLNLKQPWPLECRNWNSHETNHHLAMIFIFIATVCVFQRKHVCVICWQTTFQIEFQQMSGGDGRM